MELRSASLAPSSIHHWSLMEKTPQNITTAEFVEGYREVCYGGCERRVGTPSALSFITCPVLFERRVKTSYPLRCMYCKRDNKLSGHSSHLSFLTIVSCPGGYKHEGVRKLTLTAVNTMATLATSGLRNF